jgi:hypothetical protein
MNLCYVYYRIEEVKVCVCVYGGSTNLVGGRVERGVCSWFWRVACAYRGTVMYSFAF